MAEVSGSFKYVSYLWDDEKAATMEGDEVALLVYRSNLLGADLRLRAVQQARDVGVMADEVETVLPQAVCVHPDGYKMVNYALLGMTR